MFRLLSILLLAAPATQPAAAPTTGPTTRAATRAITPRKSSEEINRAILESHNLIAAAQFEDARKLLEPILKSDPYNPRLNLALGYSLLKLGNAKAALPKLERAYAAEPPVRTLVLTLASALQTENPMRGARILKEYMESKPQPDEELQNALGSILDHAAGDPKVNKENFYEECRAFYLAYDKRLVERHAHGEGHWGTQWIAADAADEKWKTLISREKTYVERRRTAELSTRATAAAKDQLQVVHNGFGLYSDRDRKKAADNYKAAVADEKRAYAALAKAEAALEKTEKPPFEKSIATPPFWQKE